MINKFIHWLRVKSVKREQIIKCERDAIKADMDGELNSQPAKDLEKGIHEIELHIKDLNHEADEFERQADAIAGDETMDPKLRYDKAAELRQSVRDKRNEIPDQEKLIEDYKKAIQQFKGAVANSRRLAQAHRVKAEFIRQNY